MLFTPKNVVFSYYTYKKIFAPKNGGEGPDEYKYLSLYQKLI